MKVSEALLSLPGLTRHFDWPRIVHQSTLRQRPILSGQPQVFALCLPESPGVWIEQLLKNCSPERGLRAGRYRHDVDALRCLAAEALLHLAAKEGLDLDDEETAVAHGPYGKPYFAAHPEAHFNLSHSGAWILCAVHDAPVGVDVEQEAPERMDTHTFMSPQEALRHSQLKREDRPNHFFRLWTLKESLLKAAGTGLGHDPRRITLSLEASGVTLEGAPIAPLGTRWVLDSLPMPVGAAAALCFAGPGPRQ